MLIAKISDTYWIKLYFAANKNTLEEWGPKLTRIGTLEDWSLKEEKSSEKPNLWSDKLPSRHEEGMLED